jgi:hypothetical protein
MNNIHVFNNQRDIRVEKMPKQIRIYFRMQLKKKKRILNKRRLKGRFMLSTHCTKISNLLVDHHKSSNTLLVMCDGVHNVVEEEALS